MLPQLTQLKELSKRPRGVTPTGRMGGYQRWMITEFKKGNEYFYKHQKFDWTRKGDVFIERWYSLREM